MEDFQTINVNIGEKSNLLVVKENCTIDSLIEQICKKWLHDMPPADLELIYVGTPLRFGMKDPKGTRPMTLHDLHVNKPLSTFTVVMVLEGGVWPLAAMREKKYNLRPLPGFITVTSEPDMISLDDDMNSKRAKMPCGHVIGPASMTSYCSSLLSVGKYTFSCPHVNAAGKGDCSQVWEWFCVRHVACLDNSECDTFEKKLSENYLNKASGIQKCPGCQVWCTRLKTSDKCVRCHMCTSTKGEAFDFCWLCLVEWDEARNRCTNSDCDGRDRRLRILASCSTKLIKGKECPSIRGCPNCGILIEHKDECSHMLCSSCNFSFCFFCLKTKSGGRWQCSGFGGCTLQPRQTSLHGTD